MGVHSLGNVPLELDGTQLDFIPLSRLVVNGIDLPVDDILGGAIHHDVTKGTLTVTFGRVRTVETVYRYMREVV